MLRISKEQLVERWALTYSQDGYDVRAENVAGHRDTSAGSVADLQARKGEERVLVYIIDSPEALDDPETRTELESLSKERKEGTSLHVIVAAECAHDIKERLDQWHVTADLVHVT